MTDNTKKELEAINTAAYKLADEKLQQVADDVKQELKSYATAHKRTGLLNKNIKLTRKEYKNKPRILINLLFIKQLPPFIIVVVILAYLVII